MAIDFKDKTEAMQRRGQDAIFYRAPPDTGENFLFVLTTVGVPLALAIALFVFVATSVAITDWWQTWMFMFMSLALIIPLILSSPLFIWRWGKTLTASSRAGRFFRVLLLILPIVACAAALPVVFQVMEWIGCYHNGISLVCFYNDYDYAGFLTDMIFISIAGIAFSVFSAMVYYSHFKKCLHQAD